MDASGETQPDIIAEYQGRPPRGRGAEPPPLPGPRRPWRIGEMAAWALILILSGVRAIESGIYQSEAAADSQTSPVLPAACRYAVGIHELLARGGGAAAAPIKQLLADLDQQAKSPEDQLRVAIVHGELEGRPQAIERLAMLAETFPALKDDITIVLNIYVADARPAAPQWMRIHERLGWFADLALVEGRPAGDPDRGRVLNSAYGTIAVLVCGVLAGGGLTVAGLALLITGIVLMVKGRMRMAFDAWPGRASMPADRHIYLLAFTAYLALMILPGLALQWLPALRSTWLGVVVLAAAFVVGLLWPLFAGQSASEWRMALGLHTGRGILREMLSGIAGYVAGLPVIAVGVVIVIILTKLTGISATHPINQMLGGGFWTLVFVFVLASVWAPITEELMFRGAFFASLRERFGWWISAPVVALIFAIIHPQGWVAVPVLAAIALVLAGIREWRGSIIGCMTAHSLHNTTALLFVLLLMRE